MEAGNRCFDQRVPEETNRKIVDHVADINLTYSSIAREYLLREGLSPDRVIKTGSPMYEVLNKFKSTKVRTHCSGGNYFLIWPKKDPKILIQQMREKGILIRSMENKKDIGNSIRVSIGTKEQMNFFWDNYKILDLKN